MNSKGLMRPARRLVSLCLTLAGLAFTAGAAVTIGSSLGSQPSR
jgi:hypothetical protein